MKYLKIYQTHNQYSNILSDASILGKDHFRIPNISYCIEDSKIHQYKKLATTLKMYIDDFISDNPIELFFENKDSKNNYINFETYIKNYISNIDNMGSTKFKYTEEKFTWNNKEYYLWENISNSIFDNKFKYILTEIKNYDLLYYKSMEYNYLNMWSPYIAGLDKDKNIVYTENNKKVKDDWLLKVEKDPNNLFIYIDNFVDYNGMDPETIEGRAAEYGDYDNIYDYINNTTYSNTYDGRGTNIYTYTGETLIWNNKEYYLWTNADEYQHSQDSKENISYLFTETIDYEFLNSKSLVVNKDNNFCPIMAMLSNDKQVTYKKYERYSDWLIKIELYTSLYMYLDFYGETYDEDDNPYYGFKNFAKYKDGYDDPQQYLNDILDPDNYTDYNLRIYKYTGQTFNWNNQDYYLWELIKPQYLLDYLVTSHYVLTDSIDYQYLYDHSLENNINNEYHPCVMELNEDLEITNYEVSSLQLVAVRASIPTTLE